MKILHAGVSILLGLSLVAQAADATSGVDLRNSEAVHREVLRIIKTYGADPARQTKELEQLLNRVAEATGMTKELKEMVSKDQALRKKYGDPRDTSIISSSGGNSDRVVDFSAWQWKIERQPDRYVVVFNLDKKRYKAAAPSAPTVILRRKGKSPVDEERLRHGIHDPDNFRINIAFSKLGENTFQAEFWIPASEIENYLLQVSVVMEPGWQTCGVIPLK